MRESSFREKPAEIRLPPCPLPRPGDQVTWFQSARRETGILTGHTGNGKPIIVGKFQREHRPRSFHAVRLVDPFDRRGPVWEDLPRSALWLATPEEKQKFEEALTTVIPPGQSYLTLIDEIWSRGFEVFLVGGTVRDVVAGHTANDVDLVTTMPLSLGLDVLRPMFEDYKLSVHESTGYCRIGGRPADGDPFIDLKMVCLDNLGTANARFGADLSTDVSHRDFACNALFYEPKNAVIVDPTERGLQDIEDQLLTIVANRKIKSDKEAGKIAIRGFKFIARGYEPTDETLSELRQSYIPSLSALKGSEIVGYTRTQVLSKAKKEDKEEKLDRFRRAMLDFDFQKVWEKHFESRWEAILNRKLGR